MKKYHIYIDICVYIWYIQYIGKENIAIRNADKKDDGMNIIISNTSEKPIYEQITAQIKNMVMSGLLKEGDALPSMRLLAKELHISVITTKRAYEDLERDGFISTVAGKGSFIRAADTRLVREEKLKQIEELLARAVDIAGQSGITQAEVEEIVSILYQE